MNNTSNRPHCKRCQKYVDAIEQNALNIKSTNRRP